MTVYPRQSQDGRHWLSLRDYHTKLARIGFHTNVAGRCYMEFSKRWAPFLWHIPLPIAFANKLIFISSIDVSFPSPDDVDDFFDTLF